MALGLTAHTEIAVARCGVIKYPGAVAMAGISHVIGFKMRAGALGWDCGQWAGGGCCFQGVDLVNVSLSRVYFSSRLYTIT